MTGATQRFSNRVEYYIRYRPRYPEQVLDFLKKQWGLSNSSVVADIGSGTGFLAELFLKNGNPVYGVEPNPEMRAAGETFLDGYEAFRSIDGSAEATTLPDHSCDFVVAGQAFHWFDLPRAKAEFHRILKPHGPVVLLWNERRMDTPFLRAYEQLLLDYGTDYREIDHRKIGPEVLQEFFGTTEYAAMKFPHTQESDYRALEGRLLSCSYIPLPGQPRFAEMICALQSMFSRHQRNGAVSFVYDTQLYASPFHAG